jgi:hypothetical protein
MLRQATEPGGRDLYESGGPHERGRGGRYDRGVIDLLNRDAGRTIRLATVVNAFCFVILLFWDIRICLVHVGEMEPFMFLLAV